LFVAGEITGEMSIAKARRQGRIAGLSALADLYPKKKIQASLDRLLHVGKS
jgi:hypothetical protein